ncbi:MAG: SUMF1/EgtB/PvdO family nonheme iron enzyme [Deltaproteobacteria bacterium]|nr:SUMF1/EgtB/PvdO family nonheme iron enzyme [Deltaproteobacteria bacterium]
MVRNILNFLVLSAILLTVHPILLAGTLEKRDEAGPVALLQQEQEEAREKQQNEIADLMDKIRAMETEIQKLDSRIDEIKGAREMPGSILDKMHELVKKKEQLLEELKAEKKDLAGKEKDLNEGDAKRLEELEGLKATLKKDERKQRVAALKQDLHKYETIVSSPSVENMDIKKFAWKALVAKYPEEGQGLTIGDTEELKFRVNYGGIANSIGMRFVLIQAGKFSMGSPDKEKFRSKNETRHKVMLTRPFYLQTTEVTQGQWIEIMGENPSESNRCGNDCPVENVSWDDCQKFIHRLNQLERTSKYRLPTEAEWEYACRARRTVAFATGAIAESGCRHDPNLDKMGWYCANAWRKTHPVAQKKMNKWGLYDMHGNVWEWCQDWYGQYPKGAATDPKGARFGPKRVIRGGSYRNYAENCRSAYRFAYRTDLRMNNVGFRIAGTR